MVKMRAKMWWVGEPWWAVLSLLSVGDRFSGTPWCAQTANPSSSSFLLFGSGSWSGAWSYRLVVEVVVVVGGLGAWVVVVVEVEEVVVVTCAG